jgi:hypothetical protein
MTCSRGTAEELLDRSAAHRPELTPGRARRLLILLERLHLPLLGEAGATLPARATAPEAAGRLVAEFRPPVAALEAPAP